MPQPHATRVRNRLAREAAHTRLVAAQVAALSSEPATGEPLPAAPALGASTRARGAGAVRSAWIDWLAPVFSDNGSCYFTGTYSDAYGEPHGLMAVRNVMKDFARWLAWWDFGGRYIVGVEKHRYRDILHLHAIIEGPFSAEQMELLKHYWQHERGFARALPVLDGCSSYVTKYALKGDSDSFDWRLS